MKVTNQSRTRDSLLIFLPVFFRGLALFYWRLDCLLKIALCRVLIAKMLNLAPRFEAATIPNSFKFINPQSLNRFELRKSFDYDI